MTTTLKGYKDVVLHYTEMHTNNYGFECCTVPVKKGVDDPNYCGEDDTTQPSLDSDEAQIQEMKRQREKNNMRKFRRWLKKAVFFKSSCRDCCHVHDTTSKQVKTNALLVESLVRVEFDKTGTQDVVECLLPYYETHVQLEEDDKLSGQVDEVSKRDVDAMLLGAEVAVGAEIVDRRRNIGQHDDPGLEGQEEYDELQQSSGSSLSVRIQVVDGFQGEEEERPEPSNPATKQAMTEVEESELVIDGVLKRLNKQKSRKMPLEQAVLYPLSLIPTDAEEEMFSSMEDMSETQDNDAYLYPSEEDNDDYRQQEATFESASFCNNPKNVVHLGCLDLDSCGNVNTGYFKTEKDVGSVVDVDSQQSRKCPSVSGKQNRKEIGDDSENSLWVVMADFMDLDPFYLLESELREPFDNEEATNERRLARARRRKAKERRAKKSKSSQRRGKGRRTEKRKDGDNDEMSTSKFIEVGHGDDGSNFINVYEEGPGESSDQEGLTSEDGDAKETSQTFNTEAYFQPIEHRQDSELTDTKNVYAAVATPDSERRVDVSQIDLQADERDVVFSTNSFRQPIHFKGNSLAQGGSERETSKGIPHRIDTTDSGSQITV